MPQTHSSSAGLHKYIPLCLLALVVLPVVSGCVLVAAGAGAGAVAYVRGEMTASVEHNLEAVFKSSQQALEKLEFARVSDHKSGVDAQLVARTALDKRVEIKLTRVTDSLTKVQIRVGLIGDQDLSLLILEKIKGGL